MLHYYYNLYVPPFLENGLKTAGADGWSVPALHRFANYTSFFAKKAIAAQSMLMVSSTEETAPSPVSENRIYPATAKQQAITTNKIPIPIKARLLGFIVHQPFTP